MAKNSEHPVSVSFLLDVLAFPVHSVCLFIVALRFSTASQQELYDEEMNSAFGARPSPHRSLLSGLKRKKLGSKYTNPVSGARPFYGEFSSERSRCSVCGKTFAHHHSMLRHKWKCEGTRLIVCAICGHKAHRSDHYWLHMKTHGVRRPKE